jgi:lipopolysaccharide/colanic/teichoic acid biosynthesis glycosyltransferase
MMNEADSTSETTTPDPGLASHSLDRQKLLQELSRRYGGAASWRLRLRFYRKKYAWLAVVSGSVFLKRLIDIFAAAFFLVALSPLFLVVATLIKLTDGGPVLYWQTRVGRWGREFPFPKFRSMVANSDKLRQQLLQANDHGDGGITFKMKRDPRITPIGRIIRKFSIDEMPQLWCVLQGDMSLVGPRPPIPSEVARYTLRDRRRLEVIPGLTCIWQVSGRSDIPFDRQVEMDIDYIESQSLWFDIVLLLRTVPAVLLGKGAY